MNGTKWKKVPGGIEGGQEGNTQPAVSHGIKQSVRERREKQKTPESSEADVVLVACQPDQHPTEQDREQDGMGQASMPP